MAPPKATLPQRLISQDFLGIRWGKVTWRTPYQNMYPITVTGGWAGRMWSNPISFGHFANRCTWHALRTLTYMAPTAYFGLMVFLMADWYQVMKIHVFCTMQEMPEWAAKKHSDEMVNDSYNKPGAMAKHHYAGAVSIPGTENFVAEM